MPERLPQIRAKEKNTAPGFSQDTQFYQRFSDFYNGVEGKHILPVREIPDTPMNKRNFVGTDGNPYNDELADSFFYNDRNLSDFYKKLEESKVYKGMWESIGRVTIYASQYLQNPFAKFIKDPLTYGNAHMAGVFRDIQSHEWYPKPDPNNLTDELELGWLFRGSRPELETTVSRINFSREIALYTDAREFARYCQTPEMVGEIGAALMGQSHSVYMNDLREASKAFFCGVLRIGKEPVTTSVYGADPINPQPEPPIKSPMVECFVIECENNGVKKTLDQMGEELASNVTRKIHNTLEVDFADFSDKFNPTGLNRFSEKCTVVFDANVRYDVFKHYYSILQHPEFIKPGPSVEFIWINKFPVLGTGIFASREFPDAIYKDPEDPKPDELEYYRWYELIAMIVDDNNLAIIPNQQPVTVQTHFNAHKETTTIFTHYQCIFEFKPFFNRKYIFAEYRSKFKPPEAKI